MLTWMRIKNHCMNQVGNEDHEGHTPGVGYLPCEVTFSLATIMKGSPQGSFFLWKSASSPTSLLHFLAH